MVNKSHFPFTTQWELAVSIMHSHASSLWESSTKIKTTTACRHSTFVVTMTPWGIISTGYLIQFVCATNGVQCTDYNTSCPEHWQYQKDSFPCSSQCRRWSIVLVARGIILRMHKAKKKKKSETKCKIEYFPISIHAIEMLKWCKSYLAIVCFLFEFSPKLTMLIVPTQ